ncbi:phage holin family protein, partial [Streptomyces sp.]|uniref:phage holin family protein n=1 Tax=Streptomyces sp. TaxID=1931 RepID=UPI0028117D1B
MDTAPFEALGRAAGQPLVEGDRRLEVVDADAQCRTQNLHGHEPSYRPGGEGTRPRMKPLDHLEHLDRHLVDELAQVARETVRDELREQTRKQRRKAALYAASGALALYAGAAVALAVGLALALVLPDWAAALITAAILGALAYLLRGMAKPS